MGFEIQLIRTAALDKGLVEGTDFRFTCNGDTLETLPNYPRKKIFDQIMGNATSEFLIVGGIPLTEDYVKKYTFSYQTYETTLNAIYKPAATDKFFFLQADFQGLYIMLVMAIMAGGTFLTIYEVMLMPPEGAENPNVIRPSIMGKLFLIKQNR
jgi:hypothetical protein